jgi:uncharacterized protein YegP (UPF0339 family)
MAGKFELYTDAKGKFRFRLKAGNGEIIAVGEAYESKTAAMNGIDSIRRHAAEASVQDLTAASAKPSPKPAPKPAPKATTKPAAAPTASAPMSAEHMAHH